MFANVYKCCETYIIHTIRDDVTAACEPHKLDETAQPRFPELSPVVYW